MLDREVDPNQEFFSDYLLRIEEEQRREVIMAPRPPMSCQATNCTFETESNDDSKDQLTEMQIHVQVMHTLVQQQQQIERDHLRDRDRQDRTEEQKIKVSHCTIWPENYVFEEWKQDLDLWEKTAKKAKLDNDARLYMLKESLKISPNKEAKDYYNSVMVSDGHSTTSWDTIMTKLQQKFGRNQDEDWTCMIRQISEFKWGEMKAADSWERLERLKLQVGKLTLIDDPTPGVAARKIPCPTIEKFMDEVLIRKFIDKCKTENKFETAEVMKIEEELRTKKYNWEDAKKSIKENKINREREKVLETHFQRRGRSPFRKQSNERYGSNHNQSRTSSPFKSRSQSPIGKRNDSKTRHDSKTRYNSNSKSRYDSKPGDQNWKGLKSQAMNNEDLTKLVKKMMYSQEKMAEDIKSLLNTTVASEPANGGSVCS